MKAASLSQRESQAGPSGGELFTSMLRPFFWPLALVLLLLTALAATNMVLPFALKVLVDDVFPTDGVEGNWRLLWIILPGVALLYVVRNVFFFTSRMFSVRIAEDLCVAQRSELFEHLQRLGLDFYRANQVGRISSRVLDDTYKIQLFIQDKFPTLLLNVLMFHILLIIIFVVNWKLAAVSALVLPLHFLAYRYFHAPLKRSHTQAQEHLSDVYGSLVERILGVEVVKGFSAERRESQQFSRAINATRRSQIRTQRFHFSQKVAADLLIGVGTVLLLGFGAWQVVTRTMTVGEFFMFFGYVTMLYPTVLEVLSGAAHLARATGSIERISELLEEEATELGAGDSADDRPLVLKGAITFDNVSFGYDENSPVLENINLSIAQGEHIAVVGPSGAGKTTLVSLISRFNRPTQGKMFFDDADADTLPVRSLRRCVGIAFQEVFLFNCSIFENLLYARTNATVDEIVDVCKLTGAHDFIDALPTGYGASTDEITGRFSRGEKQRITLARALLRDPAVLILDEATASLDPESSVRIMRDILDQMAGRTVVMITHDPEIAHMANRIIHIAEGRIVEIETVRHSPSQSNDEDNEDAAPATPIPPQSSNGFGPAASCLGAALLVGALTTSCVSETKIADRSVQMESPRVSHGWLTEESDAATQQALLDAIETQEAQDRLAQLRAQVELLEQTEVLQKKPNPADQPTAREARAANQTVEISRFPADAGKLHALPKLSPIEIGEIIDALKLRLQTELGYAHAGPVIADMLPALPDRVARGDIIARSTDEGLRVIRLGYRSFVSQAAQLWVYAVLIKPETVVVNPDMPAIEPAVAEALASLDYMRETLSVADLDAETIQLSFVDAAQALAALRAVGVTIVAAADQTPETIEFSRLPIVATMPAPHPDATTLIGQEQQVGRDNRGLTIIPSVASKLPNQTVAGPLAQLLLLSHPAHPEQASKVRSLLNDLIDVPARQVFIEGMILEISESGLKELGIEWQLADGSARAILGSLIPGAAGNQTLDFLFDDNQSLAANFRTQIRALIRDGKAEILSRPSILTLDNRQATIRVGEDIPIATSQEGTSGNSNKIAFDFRYIPTGILLNVRPRIDAASDQISMQIDTTVSARVPGADLEIRDADNVLLASAPTISSRRVQTYARIANNTPFIIGGLVSRDESVIEEKVPLLGDLPFVGALFRSESRLTAKREVIIVLTPYVLTDGDSLGRTIPKTEDQFDTFGNELFRDAYRLREEEVFDLEFLFKNKRLVLYKSLADHVAQRNFPLAQQPPFSLFVDDRIPSEDIVVHRMIYEVVKRLQTDARVGNDRIIYFEPDPSAGYRVQFLEHLMSRLGDGAALESFFTQNPDRALALTYTYDRELMRPGALGTEPVPEIMSIPCASREEWGKLLWDLNQPLTDGRQRYTILLHSPQDLTRLRRALLLKRIIHLNGGEERMTVRNFSVGKMIRMPDIKSDRIFVIDADVARYFYHTEHYYPATTQAIERAIMNLDEALREPELAPYLDGAQLPESP